MTTTSYPGVYIEELSSGVHTIAGVSTSIAVFIGRCEKGDKDKAVRINNMGDFERSFGKAVDKSELYPSIRMFFMNGGADAYVIRVDDVTESSILGNQDTRTGIYALDAVDLFNMVIIPHDSKGSLSDANWSTIYNTALTYATDRRAVVLVDAPGSWTSAQNAPSVDAAAVTTFTTSFGNNKKNAAVFYPKLKVGSDFIGPSGAIAGVIARTDATRGVWKAPAGLDAGIGGALDVQVPMTDAQQGVLNPLGVNVIRRFTSGITNWGARTLDASTDNMYLPVRRLQLYIEESLYRGTQWVVFEPNGERLWAQIRMNVGAFMMRLFKDGALQGTSADQAFFVKCDIETTPSTLQNLGQVVIQVGFAPLKPAEFVIIQIQQTTAQ